MNNPSGRAGLGRAIALSGVMIRHIVLFRARDPRDREAVLTGLSLLRSIPAASVLEVELNSRIDPWSD